MKFVENPRVLYTWRKSSCLENWQENGDQDRKNATLVSFDPSSRSQNIEMSDFEEILTQPINSVSLTTSTGYNSGALTAAFQASTQLGPGLTRLLTSGCVCAGSLFSVVT